jgi:hypothetical protein
LQKGRDSRYRSKERPGHHISCGGGCSTVVYISWKHPSGVRLDGYSQHQVPLNHVGDELNENCEQAEADENTCKTRDDPMDAFIVSAAGQL